MEAVAVAVAKAVVKSEPLPDRWEEGDLTLLAYEVWHQTNCPETEINEHCAETELLCHASSL